MKFLMIVLALSSFSAFADECDFGVQSRAQTCRMNRADRILTATYNSVMARFSAEDARTFRAGQRLWNQMRDNHCAVEGKLFPDYINVTEVTCKTRLAESRNKDLQELLDLMNAEG